MATAESPAGLSGALMLPCVVFDDAAASRVLVDVVVRAARLAPDDLPALISSLAKEVGARDVRLYLVDYSQRVLLAWAAVPGDAASAQVAVDGTLAGLAFRSASPHEGEVDGERTLWLPLLDGTERIGVCEIVAPCEQTSLPHWEAVAALVGILVAARRRGGDQVERIRRRREMSLAAEMQWNLLPPLSMATPRVAISGLLEPAYEVGGDVFDYAVNGDVLHLAIIDAMGHGVRASTVASVAIGAYRRGRRAGLSLLETYAEMDAAVGEQFAAEAFATAQIAELDLTTGVLTWIASGHPAQFIIRDRKVVKTMWSEPTLPLGLGNTVLAPSMDIPTPGRESLEPNDRLFLFSDGVIEARSFSSDPFGEQRLRDLLEREEMAEQSLPETNRQLAHALVDFYGGRLSDDATMLYVEWCGHHRGPPAPQRSSTRPVAFGSTPSAPGPSRRPWSPQ